MRVLGLGMSPMSHLSGSTGAMRGVAVSLVGCEDLCPGETQDERRAEHTVHCPKQDGTSRPHTSPSKEGKPQWLRGDLRVLAPLMAEWRC